jgi:PhnB protein
MSKPSLIQQLDGAIEQLLTRAGAPSAALTDGATPTLRELISIAEDLCYLPSVEFQAKLQQQLGATMSTQATSTAASQSAREPDRRTLTPYLTIAGAEKLVAFLKEAFGAQERDRTMRPDGAIAHAELRIAGNLLEVSEGNERSGTTPMDFILFVDDADAAYQGALAAGASSLYAPVTQSWGDRDAGIEDPSGNDWFLTTRRESEHNPRGGPAIVPGLHPRGAAQFIAFLKSAFGADDSIRHDAPDGTVRHARLRLGNAYLAVGEAHGPWQPRPARFRLWVTNVDEVYAQALRAGAQPLGPPSDKPYGERSATVTDSMGNLWFISAQADVAHAQQPQEPQPPESPASYLPAGFRTITPYIMVEHAAEVLQFVERALDGKLQLRVDTPDGKIMHSQIQLGNSMMELADYNPQYDATPMAIVLAVADADRTYQRALEAGAQSLWEPRTESYGDRDAGVRDAGGNIWCFYTRYVAPHHPADEQAAVPHLNPESAAKYIPFLEAAFGATLIGRYDDASGRVVHAVVKIGDAYLTLNDRYGAWPARRAALHLYVPDCDAAYERALAAGAQSNYAPRNEPYGDRASAVTDPAGNQWFIATRLRQATSS